MGFEFLFQTLATNRKWLVQTLEDSSERLLFTVPEGFRNNIYWNIAHILVVQQLLCYKLSGLPMQIEDALIGAYSKGTIPGKPPTEEERREMSRLLLSTPERLKNDYQNGKFRHYKEYTTGAGVTLSRIEDGLFFNLFHEGIHLGVILSIRKILKDKK